MTRDISIRTLLIGSLASLLLPAVWAIASPGAAADDQDNENGGVKFSLQAETTFKQRCSACHTYGKGIKVGPDLKGVSERRKHEWLIRFIRQSSAVIKSGDPVATGLFAEFKKQRMPDWTDLSEKDINDILYYLSVGGPDFKPADERHASTATAADQEAGRMLFLGEKRFRYGALSCATCHSVQSSGWRGGALGPDLSTIYTKFQDIAMTSFLRHPCFPWKQETPEARYLTARESFLIKALLYREARQGRGAGTAGGSR